MTSDVSAGRTSALHADSDPVLGQPPRRWVPSYVCTRSSTGDAIQTRLEDYPTREQAARWVDRCTIARQEAA